MQGNFLDESRVGTHTAVELRAVGQRRESILEVALGVEIKVSLTRKPGEAGEDGEGKDLAFREGSLRAGPLSQSMRLAKVIHDDVECSEEGVHVEHGSVPFPSGLASKPTLVRGCLPLKFRADNSHQAFKRSGAS